MSDGDGNKNIAMILIVLIVILLIAIVVIIIKTRNTDNTPVPTLMKELFTSDTSDTSDNTIENFPQNPMNIMYSDSNGNLSSSTDLTIQNLTVNGDSVVSGNSTVEGKTNLKGDVTVDSNILIKGKLFIPNYNVEDELRSILNRISKLDSLLASNAGGISVLSTESIVRDTKIGQLTNMADDRNTRISGLKIDVDAIKKYLQY